MGRRRCSGRQGIGENGADAAPGEGTDLIGLGISLVLLYYGSAVVSDAWRNDMIAYKTWYVPEWLLFLAIPVSALMLAIEFVLRFMRVQGVVRDSYDVTGRASL